MIVLRDVCCERKTPKDKAADVNEEDIEDLFKNNTKMAPIED